MSTLIVGCGYLGRRVGQRLAGRGERVFGTSRDASRAADLAGWGIEPVTADVLDPMSLANLPRSDRVLYCVGFDRSSGIAMRTVYVDGLRNVLNALAGKTERVVSASATSVYGRNDGGWVGEDTPAEPATESGRVCLDAESLAADLCGRLGLDLVIVRFSGLYGPGRVPRREALRRGDPVVGDPETYVNLIHIDDAGSAAIAALDRGQPGRVYLASDGSPVKRRDYCAQVARTLGAPAPRFVAAEPESPEARREESNKRVSNRRITEELGLILDHPDCLASLGPLCLDEA